MDSVTQQVDPLVMRAQTRVGSTLQDKWRLDVLIGVGGMASVYAATHRNGSRAAIKLLHPELMLHSEVRARFLREGYAANAVGHDGCVKIIGDDTAEDGALFLVTELLDGETLEDRRVRAGGRLSEDEVLSIADQLLDVLAAAHSKGVIHRDIKPENIFITRTGQVKVLDFGIARLKELSTKSTATKTGATMGTPVYMPPEQALGRWDDVDGRSDLWAVGATMFHLLTGRFVHEGRTTQEHLLGAMSKEAQPIGQVAPEVALNVAKVVDTALRFDRNARWVDATAMQDAVRHAYHDRHGVPITTAPRLTVPPSVPNRTLSSAHAPVPRGRPTTGQPVESGSRGGASVASVLGSRRWMVAAVFGGAASVGVVAAVVVVGLSGRHGETTVSSGVPSLAPPLVVAPTTSLSASPVASGSASALPTIALTNLPSVTQKPSGKPRTTRAAPPASTPPAPTTAPPPAQKPPCPINALGNKVYGEDCE